jgi:hypothetical protein
VSPVKYELCFCIPEDDVLHSHRRETLKPYWPLFVHRTYCVACSYTHSVARMFASVCNIARLMFQNIVIDLYARRL